LAEFHKECTQIIAIYKKTITNKCRNTYEITMLIFYPHGAKIPLKLYNAYITCKKNYEAKQLSY